MANQNPAQAPGPEIDIRGVLIQVAGGRLLLPNATIAEVLSYAEPDAVAGAPDWLLGRIRWRGWQLPLVAFGRLSGLASERGGLGSKVLVLRALGGNTPVEGRRTPYFALLTQGFPRLVTVSRETLMVVEDNNPLPNGVQARVLLNEDAAFLPDLGIIEEQIGVALAQAA
ncbi:MAG TPA: chemotaxis protein CheW [Lysobacter sp.]